MRTLLYTTSEGTEVYVQRGTKSPSDFKVTYDEVGKRTRTPKHIHLIVDLYLKRAGNPTLANQLVDHIINNLVLKVKPIQSFPPSLQIFQPTHVKQFQPLDAFGEYSVEFLLILTELILIQEKTNYPDGTMSFELFTKFRRGDDIFTVVSAATFRGG